MRLCLTCLRAVGLGGGEPSALANVFMQVTNVHYLIIKILKVDTKINYDEFLIKIELYNKFCLYY